VWSAPDVNLTVSARGGKLEQGCASGSFGPVRPDSRGRFRVAGTFEPYQPGRQRAQEGADERHAAVRFDGSIRGETLLLTVRPAHGPAEAHMLLKGKRTKTIRCY
jgi:hypothetical protein